MADIAFSTPDYDEQEEEEEDVAGQGSYLISTSVKGGVIVYRIPDAQGTKEDYIRATDADGTVC